MVGENADPQLTPDWRCEPRPNPFGHGMSPTEPRIPPNVILGEE